MKAGFSSVRSLLSHLSEVVPNYNCDPNERPGNEAPALLRTTSKPEHPLSPTPRDIRVSTTDEDVVDESRCVIVL